jgi:hypothetical protein
MKKIEVGDILFSTFGYEACLARFWKVVGRTAKSLKIAQILDQKHTGNWHAGTSVPVINGNLGPVMVRRIIIADWNKSESVDTNGRGFAYPWDGEPIDTYNHH